MTKPITPVEFDQLKVEQVPPLVYEAINTLLLHTTNCVRGSLVISLEELKSNISSLFDNSNDMSIMVDKALAQYRNNGWDVHKSVFDWDDPEPEVIYFKRA